MNEIVSLSKILDAFIIENKNASSIVQFLQDHKHCITEIFKYSFHWKTIYQLNFIYELKDDVDKLEFLFTYCTDVQIRYLYWQVLQYKKYHELCNLSALIKILSRYFNSLPILKHPYHSHLSNISQRVDVAICKNLDVVDTIQRLSTSEFTLYVKNITTSLYFDSVFNIDVYLSLSIAHRYIFLTHINYIDGKFDNFCMQLLNSTKITTVEKQTLCNCYYNAIRYESFIRTLRRCIKDKSQFSDNILKAIIHSDFSTLLLECTIQGQNIIPIIFFLCILKKFDVLKDWYNYAPSDITDNLNVSDIVISKKV